MTYKFKHFLNFISINQIGRIQISEPFGFDGSSMTIKQGDNYGRDVVIFNDEIDLEFTKENFELMQTEQQFIDATPFIYASQGYDYLVNVLENEGWEGLVQYIVQDESGVDFVIGNFDYFTAQFQKDCIKFKIIQNTQRELIKRRADVEVDAFSSKDLDGNNITPCQTSNILLKAKPTEQNSILGTTKDEIIFSSGLVAFPSFFNPVKNITNFGIEDTLSWLENYSAFPYTLIPPMNFKVFRAKKTITGLKVFIKMTIKVEWLSNPLPANAQIFGYLSKGLESDTIADFGSKIYLGTQFYASPPLGPTSGIFINEQIINQSFDLPNLNQGEVLYFIFIHGAGNSGQGVKTTINIDTSFDFTATSTGIDSVVKGVRLIDLFKHNINSIGNVPTIASDYDIGGKDYNNFVFNGKMIGQLSDITFNNKFSDLTNILGETNSGFQINPNKVEILPYSDFYTNNEIGVFDELADEENTTTFDKDYFIKTLEIGFKSSSKGRETNGQNTIDDVHGEGQYLFSSKVTDGNLKVNLSHIRSAFIIETQRERITNSSETATLQYDDNLFIVDVVENSPTAKSGFAALLTQQQNGTELKILATNFSWNLLGFILNSQFTITAGRNIGNYTVTEITNSLLTLTGTSLDPFTGSSIITVEYFLSGVNFVNRTNEGFSLIEGVKSANDYSNLRYSIGRIRENWNEYLATGGRYLPNGNISNTKLEPNNNLITRLITETENVIDAGTIQIADISELKIVDPILHEVTVFASFDTVKNFVEDVQTVKGFARVRLSNNTVIKGYPKELDYEYATQSLTMKLQQKHELNIVAINGEQINGILYKNYSYKLFEIFVSLYDVNNIPIINPIRFTNISLNGVLFTNLDAFTETINIMINE